MSDQRPRRGWRLVLLGAIFAILTALLNLGADGGVLLAHDDDDDDGRPFEVWTIDQQDTIVEGGGSGGLIYIYPSDTLMANAATAAPEVIDLGGAVRQLCLARTGIAPRRPHMLTFNGGDYDVDRRGHTHALLSFVVSGHVVVFDAATRAPLDCLKPGLQAHAVWPTPNQRHIVVADQNGRKLHRVRTDYAANVFTLETTLDLANCTTPSGAACTLPALRDDNAPICGRADDANRFTFVTLRGGGLFVIDHNATPMRIVAEYDRTTIWTGCGIGEGDGKVYVNSGSLPARLEGHDVYVLKLSDFRLTGTPPNTPAPRLVYARTSQQPLDLDSHGGAFTKHKRYLWVNDRIQNDVTVIDTRTDRVVGRFGLASNTLSSDPAPDIFDLSPSGNRMFVTLRGPAPQTGAHAAFGNTPGLGVIKVLQGGRTGKLVDIARLPDTRVGVPADPHGVRVRHLRGQ